MKGTQAPESYFIANGYSGTVFFTLKNDKDITAIATYYKRKVRTERLVLVGGTKDNPTAQKITKVTIIA